MERRYYSCKIDFPKAFKDKVFGLVRAGKDENSMLESYIHLSGFLFGNEWFYGYGSLYRWREGQREKAQERVEKYLTTKDKNNFKKLQEAIAIKEDIAPFEADKVMGVY